MKFTRTNEALLIDTKLVGFGHCCNYLPLGLGVVGGIGERMVAPFLYKQTSLNMMWLSCLHTISIFTCVDVAAASAMLV